jgi:hypothetical protein
MKVRNRHKPPSTVSASNGAPWLQGTSTWTYVLMADHRLGTFHARTVLPALPYRYCQDLSNTIPIRSKPNFDIGAASVTSPGSRSPQLTPQRDQSCHDDYINPARFHKRRDISRLNSIYFLRKKWLSSKAKEFCQSSAHYAFCLVDLASIYPQQHLSCCFDYRPS